MASTRGSYEQGSSNVDEDTGPEKRENEMAGSKNEEEQIGSEKREDEAAGSKNEDEQTGSEKRESEGGGSKNEEEQIGSEKREDEAAGSKNEEEQTGSEKRESEGGGSKNEEEQKDSGRECEPAGTGHDDEGVAMSERNIPVVVRSEQTEQTSEDGQMLVKVKVKVAGQMWTENGVACSAYVKRTDEIRQKDLGKRHKIKRKNVLQSGYSDPSITDQPYYWVKEDQDIECKTEVWDESTGAYISKSELDTSVVSGPVKGAKFVDHAAEKLSLKW